MSSTYGRLEKLAESAGLELRACRSVIADLVEEHPKTQARRLPIGRLMARNGSKHEENGSGEWTPPAERTCLFCGEQKPMAPTCVRVCGDCYATHYPISAKARGYGAPLRAVREYKPSKGRLAGKRINAQDRYACGCTTPGDTYRYPWTKNEKPDPNCVACHGSGWISDNAHLLRKIRTAGDATKDQDALEAIYGEVVGEAGKGEKPGVGAHFVTVFREPSPSTKQKIDRNEKLEAEALRGATRSTLATAFNVSPRHAQRLTKATREKRKHVQVLYELGGRRPNKERRVVLESALGRIDQWAYVARTRIEGPTLAGFHQAEVVDLYRQEVERELNSARTRKERNEMSYVSPLPTNAELAADATRLQVIALDLASIAHRVAERFPENEAVTAAVEEFLGDLPKNGH